ncbi:hypothetical protein HOY80DRAFT_953238 [Tuber brumale]|nr:hypothetical protein HOY80DRAFT_953238 [Tuber brumale]
MHERDRSCTRVCTSVIDRLMDMFLLSAANAPRSHTISSPERKQETGDVGVRHTRERRMGERAGKPSRSPPPAGVKKKGKEKEKKFYSLPEIITFGTPWGQGLKRGCCGHLSKYSSTHGEVYLVLDRFSVAWFQGVLRIGPRFLKNENRQDGGALLEVFLVWGGRYDKERERERREGGGLALMQVPIGRRGTRRVVRASRYSSRVASASGDGSDGNLFTVWCLGGLKLLILFLCTLFDPALL